MAFRVSGRHGVQRALMAAATVAFSIQAAMGSASGGSGSYTPTHFVTANATGTGDGSQANPWTMAQALANAVSGNVVRVEAGVYTRAASGVNYIPAFNPANFGTAIAPIIFYAATPANTLDVVSPFKSELRTSGGTGPAIGSYQRDYVTFDGFYVDETNVSPMADTGPAVLWDCTGAKILRCQIRGTTTAWGDNHNGIRFEYTTSCEASNNLVDGFYVTSTNSYNGAGILLYASTGYTINNNEIRNCRTGLYFKGAAGAPAVFLRTPGVCSKNYIHDCPDGGVSFGGVNRNSGILAFYQNVVANCGWSPIRWQTWADPAPLDVWVVNNTFYGFTENGMWFGTQTLSASIYNGCTAYNNVFSGPASLSAIVGNGALSVAFTQIQAINHNRWHGFTYFYTDDTSGAHGTFATYQGLGFDVNGSVGDPLLVAPLSGNYRLQVGSPCRVGGAAEGFDYLNLAGGGAINLGAYITDNQSDVIGVY